MRRRANRSLLLRTLHRDGPLSRADLAKVTGLTRATVSAVVRDLIDDGVVEELGLSTAGGVGKPATLVDVAADGRHVLCLDLSEPARFVGALVNLAGKVVVPPHVRPQGQARDGAPSRSSGGSAASWSPMPSARCSASASPAPASSTPTASSSPPPTSAGPACRSAPTLAAEFGLPVAVVNDANAAALAELTFGERPASNLICVRVDEGVGAGLVLDGRLFAGSTYAAGEIGHVVVVPDGAVCACGKRGCLETEVSAPLLAGRLEADAGDGTAVLERAGEHLGTALATVLSALDVADVVLSGSGAVADRDVPRRRRRRHRRPHDAGPRRPPRRARRHVRLRRRARRRRRPGPRPRAGHPMTASPTRLTRWAQGRTRPPTSPVQGGHP